MTSRRSLERCQLWAAPEKLSRSPARGRGNACVSLSKEAETWSGHGGCCLFCLTLQLASQGLGTPESLQSVGQARLNAHRIALPTHNTTSSQSSYYHCPALTSLLSSNPASRPFFIVVARLLIAAFSSTTVPPFAQPRPSSDQRHPLYSIVAASTAPPIAAFCQRSTLSLSILRRRPTLLLVHVSSSQLSRHLQLRCTGATPSRIALISDPVARGSSRHYQSQRQLKTDCAQTILSITVTHRCLVALSPGRFSRT